MAANDFLTSAKVKLREGDIGYNRPNSEAVNQKIGASVNSLIDSSFYNLDVSYPGYIGSSALFDSGPFYIENPSKIISWELSLMDSGDSGTTTFNCSVYDNTGALKNPLFGSTGAALAISGSSGIRVIVGKNFEEGTQFSINTAGHTFTFGTLNINQLSAGDFLVPYIVGAATSARSLRFKLRIREN